MYQSIPTKISLTRENLTSLSRIGVLDRISMDEIRDPGLSSEFDSYLTPQQKNFLLPFEQRTSYFLHDFLPYNKKDNIDRLYSAVALHDRRIFKTIVSKEERKVRVCRTFDGFDMRTTRKINVTIFKSTESQLNLLLKMAFEGANADPQFKYKCTVIIETDQLVFEWTPLDYSSS